MSDEHEDEIKHRAQTVLNDYYAKREASPEDF
jgi:hypothetical protein